MAISLLLAFLGYIAPNFGVIPFLILEPAQCMILISEIVQVTVSFLSQDILPRAMRSLAVGLVTITVAVAVFLAEKGNNLEFDRLVILEEIIDGRAFIQNFTLLFLASFLWGLVSIPIKLVLFITYLYGVLGFVLFLRRSYYWVQEIEILDSNTQGGYRQKKRQEFLENTDPGQQDIVMWESVWALDKISVTGELEFFKKFREKVSTLLNEGEKEHVDGYLTSLRESLDDISLEYHRIFEKLWEAALDWHETIFEKYDSNQSTDNFQLKNASEKLLTELTEKFMSSGNAYIYFEALEEAFSADSEVEEDFIENVIEIIGPILFSNTSAADTENIWIHFHDSWKCTKENIIDSENHIARIWAKIFFKWAEPRIRESYEHENFDRSLNNAMRKLFPNADPPTLSIILSFVYLQYWSSERDLEAFVRTPRTFGGASHVQSGFVESGDPEELDFEDDIEQERLNAIELGKHFFGGVFTEDRIEDYLEELDFDTEDDAISAYRDRIKEIFKEMNREE
jgi:hypothetical protein